MCIYNEQGNVQSILLALILDRVIDLFVLYLMNENVSEILNIVLINLSI
jgi:hypothetical protein